MRPAKLVGMALLAVLALLAWQPNVPATAAAPESCTGVWVVVDPGDLGGEPTISCAPAFANGTQALESAGFKLNRLETMLCQIDSLPSDCVVKGSAYWSYWQSAPAPDHYSDWVYAIKGADVYHPTAGAAEGWRFGNGSVGPRVLPETLANVPETSEDSNDSGTPASPPQTQGEVQQNADVPAGNPTGLIVGGMLVILIAAVLVIRKLRHG